VNPISISGLRVFACASGISAIEAVGFIINFHGLPSFVGRKDVKEVLRNVLVSLSVEGKEVVEIDQEEQL